MYIYEEKHDLYISELIFYTVCQCSSKNAVQQREKAEICSDSDQKVNLVHSRGSKKNPNE